MSSTQTTYNDAVTGEGPYGKHFKYDKNNPEEMGKALARVLAKNPKARVFFENPKAKSLSEIAKSPEFSFDQGEVKPKWDEAARNVSDGASTFGTCQQTPAIFLFGDATTAKYRVGAVSALMSKENQKLPAQTDEDEQLLAPKDKTETWNTFNTRVEKSEMGRKLCQYVEHTLYNDAATTLYMEIAVKIKKEDRKMLQTDYTDLNGFRLVRYIAHMAAPANRMEKMKEIAGTADLTAMGQAFDRDTSHGNTLSTTFIPEVNTAVTIATATIKRAAPQGEHEGFINFIKNYYVSSALAFIGRDPRYSMFTRDICDDGILVDTVGAEGALDVEILRQAVMQYEQQQRTIFDGSKPKITSATGTVHAMSADVTGEAVRATAGDGKELTFTGNSVEWKVRGKGGVIVGTVRIPAEDDRCYHCLRKMTDCKGGKDCPKYSDPWSMQCRAMWQRRRVNKQKKKGDGSKGGNDNGKKKTKEDKKREDTRVLAALQAQCRAAGIEAPEKLPEVKSKNDMILDAITSLKATVAETQNEMKKMKSALEEEEEDQ